MKRPSPTAMADSTEFLPPAPPNRPRKKTRDLPNLSDCHGCNNRINSTNPKNRLQILASEWRVVLLCKSCYNLVESSKCCSYCLTRVSSYTMESFNECNRCHHKIHKECVSMFSFASGNISSSDDFSVCFDCWIPKLLQNDYNARVLHSRTRKRGAKIGGEKIGVETTNSLGSSGVCDSQDKGKALEDAANDAHVVSQKKIAVAHEAKVKALDKAKVARKAVVLASSAVSLVFTDENGNQQGSIVDDDALLAFRLHRAINCSPRISRHSCLLNTHCIDVPEVNGNVRGLESRTDAATSCASKTLNAGGDEQNKLPESRQACEQKYAEIEDENRSRGSGDILVTYCRKGRTLLKIKEEPECTPRTYNEGCSGDERVKEETDCPLRTYSRKLSNVKRCKVEHGHCSKTYRRRPSIHGKTKLYGCFDVDDGTFTPACTLNRCEESRPFTTTS